MCTAGKGRQIWEGMTGYGLYNYLELPGSRNARLNAEEQQNNANAATQAAMARAAAATREPSVTGGDPAVMRKRLRQAAIGQTDQTTGNGKTLLGQ